MKQSAGTNDLSFLVSAVLLVGMDFVASCSRCQLPVAWAAGNRLRPIQ